MFCLVRSRESSCSPNITTFPSIFITGRLRKLPLAVRTPEPPINHGGPSKARSNEARSAREIRSFSPDSRAISSASPSRKVTVPSRDSLPTVVTTSASALTRASPPTSSKAGNVVGITRAICFLIISALPRTRRYTDGPPPQAVQEILLSEAGPKTTRDSCSRAS